MYTTQLRRIKKYLSILEENRFFGSYCPEKVEYCDCGYKSGNAPPTLSEFKPYRLGSSWGTGDDTHAWFHTKFTVPGEMRSAPMRLFISSDNDGDWDACNPQYIVYMDGRIRQGADINHTSVILDGDKDEYEVYIYGYTGPSIPQTKLYLRVMNVNEEVEGLYYDVAVPFESIDFLDEHSAEYAMTLTLLDEAMSMLSLYDVGGEEFLESVKKAREFMKTEFYGKWCKGGTELCSCIGHTHIDCAWKWTFAQTREKVQRSFGTVLELMKRYPEYKFMSSQPLLYKYLKEEAPEIYEEVKERVKEGRWEPEGAMWVEADCNLTSGESLVRQVIHGKRFFKEEFGVDSRVLWLPDVFGYSAAMPQILNKSGVDWFVTSKISWNETNTMPNDTFMWYGIDGSGIKTHFLTAQTKKRGEAPKRGTTYCPSSAPAVIAGSYYRYSNKNLSNESILTFGYGDGGGGPTEGHLEYLRRTEYGIPGVPRTEIKFAGEFLKGLEEKIEGNKLLPSWRGELYLEFHRGTYTSISKNKKNNRRSEFLYSDAEGLSVAANKLVGLPVPKEVLYSGWEEILNNQFHDVIPGSSIGPVYDQCDKDYEKIFEIGEEIRSTAQAKIAEKLSTGAYVVFNPHSFDTDGVVKVNGVSMRTPMIPQKGYKLVKEDELVRENHIKFDGKTLLTDRYTVRFDDCLQIESIYDKTQEREVLSSVGNELRIYADFPDRYDAWEWQPYSRDAYKTLTDFSSVEFVNDGVKAGVKITRPYLKSTIEQTVWFTDSGEKIEFETRVDWHEHHKMVKAAFPVTVNSDKASYEIQFGTIERPTHYNTSWDKAKFEVCAQKYADISEGDYGVAILNDCKYGHDIHEGVIQLSLFKSPTYPWRDADQGVIEFVYALMPHSGTLVTSNVQREAYYLNYPMSAVRTKAKASSIPEEFSLVRTNRENIICETVKTAYDSLDTVVRFYESKNSRGTAQIEIGFEAKKCFLCNLLEEELYELPITDGRVSVRFAPFEIITLKFKA